MTYDVFIERAKTLQTYFYALTEGDRVLRLGLLEGMVGDIFDSLTTAYFGEYLDPDDSYNALAGIIFQDTFNEENALKVYNKFIAQEEEG